MAPSQKCIDLVKFFESYRPMAYLCPAGVWTLGYGTTRYPDGTAVAQGDACGATDAETWLAADITKSAQAIGRLVTVPLTQNQFDALASFVYNVGAGAFKSSTLLRKLNDGDSPGAAAEFPKWVRSGNKVLPGLVKRRNAERNLFLGGY